VNRVQRTVVTLEIGGRGKAPDIITAAAVALQDHMN